MSFYDNFENNWFAEMNTILNFWIYIKAIPQSNNLF